MKTKWDPLLGVFLNLNMICHPAQLALPELGLGMTLTQLVSAQMSGPVTMKKTALLKIRMKTHALSISKKVSLMSGAIAMTSLSAL